jgi:hypothetical protein
LWQFAGEQFTTEEIELLNKVAKLDLNSLFAELLTSAEISALTERISSLLAVRQFPFPSDEWPAIPWPPV